MITPDEWNQQRSQLLSTGEEVHRHFNIGRKIGAFAALDFVRRNPRQRLLCYPAYLGENILPLHPSLMPFPPFPEGNLASKGIAVHEVPSGTVPLLRIAESFDTPASGAPQRARIFNQAGRYVAGMWKISNRRLPEDLGLEMLSYINEDEGAVAFVPPQRFKVEPNPLAAFGTITREILESGLASDVEELAYQFDSGINETLQK